jgi:hypothetical protein
LKSESPFHLDRQVAEHEKASILIVGVFQAVERRYQRSCQSMFDIVWLCLWSSLIVEYETARDEKIRAFVASQ